MKKLALYAYLLLFATTSLVLTSCGDDDSDPDPDPDPEPELNIIEWAADNGEYALLLEAAEIAGLTATLSDETMLFTIMGPKDPVFQGFLDAATGMANTPVSAFDAATLGGILSNHAFVGKLRAADLSTGYVTNAGRVAFDSTITTVAYIDVSDGVAINGGTALTGGATVTIADQEALNGIIHSIDGVLVPPKLTTFVAVDPELTSTLAALSRDDLGVDYVTAAGGDDLLTVFAPTNAAWDAYLTDNGYASVLDVPAGEMAILIPKHIVPGANARAESLTDGQMVSNLAGTMLTLNVDGSAVSVSGSSKTGNVTFPNIQTQNGVMHKIDTVID